MDEYLANPQGRAAGASMAAKVPGAEQWDAIIALLVSISPGMIGQGS